MHCLLYHSLQHYCSTLHHQSWDPDHHQNSYLRHPHNCPHRSYFHRHPKLVSFPTKLGFNSGGELAITIFESQRSIHDEMPLSFARSFLDQPKGVAHALRRSIRAGCGSSRCWKHFNCYLTPSQPVGRHFAATSVSYYFHWPGWLQLLRFTLQVVHLQKMPNRQVCSHLQSTRVWQPSLHFSTLTTAFIVAHLRRDPQPLLYFSPLWSSFVAIALTKNRLPYRELHWYVAHLPALEYDSIAPKWLFCEMQNLR